MLLLEPEPELDGLLLLDELDGLLLLDDELLFSLLLLGELLLLLPVAERSLDEDEPVPMLPVLESWVEPVLLSLLVVDDPLLLPVLLLPELCATAWPAKKTMPAVARPRPHPIFFMLLPLLDWSRSPAASPALFAVWLLKR